MATDLEQLVLSISADNRQMLRVLKKLEGDTNSTTKKVERQFADMARKIDGNLQGIGKNSFRNLLGGATAALGVGEIAKLADTWTDLTSRVNLAAGSIDAGADVMERLGEMARRTYSPLEQTVEAYIANATALRELGYATNQQLDYTEALNNALVISAAKGQRAEAVQNALAKAMAGGKLQGENLNTVIQQGGRVAEALAAGLGVGVSELRALGVAGKITSRDVFKALTSQMEKLRWEAASMPATIADGFQLLQNALLEYVGKGDQATGVSARISEALVIMADNFDKTADVALQLAGVIAGMLVGRSLAVMIAKLGLGTQALVSFTRALVAARSAGGLATAFGGLSAAAGPAGLIIGGAVVSSLLLFSRTSVEASSAAKTYAEALEQVRASAKSASEEIEAVSTTVDARTFNSLTLALETARAEIDRTKAEVFELIDALTDEYSMSFATPEQQAQLKLLRDGLNTGKVSADAASKALYDMANGDYNFQVAADKLAPLLDALGEAIAAASILQSRLGASESAPTFSRGGAGNARRSLNAQREDGRAYEAEQLRRAQLGKDQLAIENEIAKVRRQSIDDGKKLTDEQIKRIAEANLAGNVSRSAEGKKPKKERDDEYERLTAQIEKRTTALLAETEAQRGINPLIDDYGFAIERARAAQDLLTAAKEAGLAVGKELKDVQALLNGEFDELSPKAREQAEAMLKLASGYAQASAEAEKLGKSQDEIRRKAEEMQEFQKDLTRGIVDGFMQGKKAADILADSLSKLGNKLLDLAFNAAFDSPSKGGAGFNPLGFLAGMFRERGGPVKKGQPYIVGEKRPELFVPDQDGKILPSVPQVPRMPDISAPRSAGDVTVTIPINIDATGADPAELVRTQQQLARLEAEIPARVVESVRGAQKRRAL